MVSLAVEQNKKYKIVWHIFFRTVLSYQLKHPYQYKTIFSVRFADQVSISDELLVQENNELVPAKVINISSLIMKGEHWFYLFLKFLSNSLLYFYFPP